MANLNLEQRRAVECIYGPVLVLAGPGSGKTFTLVERIRHMIEEEGISPGEILVITFSKKAATDMQERFYNHTKQIYPVYFGTFHAVFFNILKQHYGLDKSSVMTEKTKREYVRYVIKKLHVDNKDETYIEDLLSCISKYKTCSDKDVAECLNGTSVSSDNTEEFMNIFKQYNDLCRKNKKIDFDDMIIMCKELLTCNKNVLEMYQKKYKYILVDEFQDINQVQYDVLRLLSQSHNNVFSVGDISIVSKIRRIKRGAYNSCEKVA